MTIEERFERLEKQNGELAKQNRRLRKCMAGAVPLAPAASLAAAAGWVGAWTANIEPSQITTQKILLKDATGRVLMLFDAAGSTLMVRNRNGRPRISMDALRGKLNFYNAYGNIYRTYP